MYYIGEFRFSSPWIKPWGPTGGINTMTSERSERVIHPYSIFNILIKYQITNIYFNGNTSLYINQSIIRV